MKHVFLINPAAGKYDHTKECSEVIHRVCGAQALDYEILVSQKPGDLTQFARRAAAAQQKVRLYACGGDGTLNEVVSGAADFPNAAVTHFPSGSGNDFIKIFSDPSRFSDLEALLDGQQAQFDLIQCGARYALNVCSMGLDARIGTEIARYKRLPGVTGSGAYVLSTLVNLLRGVHEDYRVEVDGKTFSGERTMICICSGRWYGGGFNPLPESEPDDGLLDVLMVAPVTRLQVAQVIGAYKAGRYREYPNLFHYFRAKEIKIHCQKQSVINLDGEACWATAATFRVLPGKIRFFYPKGLTYHAALPAAASV